MKYSFKMVVIFFILLYIIIAFLFYNFYKNLAIRDTKQEAISILNTTKALRNYIEEIQRPLIYRLEAEGKLAKDFFDPRILSSSYIVEKTYGILLKNAKVSYKYNLAANNPTNPNNKANKHESIILNAFQSRKIKEYFDVTEENGTEYFYIALPVGENQTSCLRCHGDPSRAPQSMLKQYGDENGFYEKAGDIRAFVSLKVPVSDIVTYHINEFVVGGLAMLFTFIVFIFMAYIFYKQELRIQLKRERILENQNKLASMGEMISNIAHQWRQPLAQISSTLVHLDLRAKRGRLTDKMVEEKVADAHKQIVFMSETIDDFRGFYLKKDQKELFNITEVIDHALHLVSASIRKNNISVHINIKNDFKIYGFKNDLVQALINLINNARDAFIGKGLPDRGIHIKAYRKNEKNILKICDNAGGIDETIIGKIFEPYFTTKHPSIGTGIGLHIVKSIIEKKYHGTIEVKCINKGTCFIFVFDLLKPTTQHSFSSRET